MIQHVEARLSGADAFSESRLQQRGDDVGGGLFRAVEGGPDFGRGEAVAFGRSWSSCSCFGRRTVFSVSDFAANPRVRSHTRSSVTRMPSAAFTSSRCGQSLVVWAINEGRGAARECDRFLMGSTDLL